VDLVALSLERRRILLGRQESSHYGAVAGTLGRMVGRTASDTGSFRAAEGCNDCITSMIDRCGGEDLRASWWGKILVEEVKTVGLCPCRQVGTAPVVEVGDNSWVKCPALQAWGGLDGGEAPFRSSYRRNLAAIVGDA
jgi:hypothetical protein